MFVWLTSDSLVPLDLHHNQVLFEVSFGCSGEIRAVKSEQDFWRANYVEINLCKFFINV